MADELRRPIKVVTVTDKDRVRPDSGGGGRKLFGDVDEALRGLWIDRLGVVEQHFDRAFRKLHVSGVAKVRLKEKALAKSHRPKELFNEKTCPVIGVKRFGELLISVSPRRLERLREKIERDRTQVGMANISTIEGIEPYTTEDAVGGEDGLEELLRAAKSDEGLKVRLFRHHDSKEDDRILRAFKRVCEALGLRPKPIRYAQGMTVFRVEGARRETAKKMARFVGVQSISSFPEYQLVDASATPIDSVENASFPLPDPNAEYPVIGIVDTGTSKNDRILKPWRVDQESFVAPYEEDPTHGSFVAGLAVHGRLLNGRDPRFPGTAARFIDVAALPGTGKLSEDDLIQHLREALPKFAKKARFWNLSLNNTAWPCTDHAFSDLAVVLDELQDKHGVVFVIPTGNPDPSDVWHRGWPAGSHLGERDRICSPADSVRGVSVASIAHEDRPHWVVHRDEPSPFSRRGPGPVFLPKPELAHYGGNCDENWEYRQKGIRSFDGKGNIAEHIGTSYAAPLVTNILANVDAGILDSPSRNLVRALTIHSAAFRRQEALDTELLRYGGFGIPGDIAEILHCTPWASTMIFEDELNAGIDLAKTPFPIPPCLRRKKKVCAGFLMTLVYEPPLDATFGPEYCRSNIDVSLGTYDIDRTTGKRAQKKQVPAEPTDIGKLYEKNLIEHGFKWSPVKVYRREIARGIKGDQWRLKLSLQHRSSFVPTGPQSFVLIVTVFDPDRRRPVYDEMLRMMPQVGWQTKDLRVDQRVLVRA